MFQAPQLPRGSKARRSSGRFARFYGIEDIEETEEYAGQNGLCNEEGRAASEPSLTGEYLWR